MRARRASYVFSLPLALVAGAAFMTLAALLFVAGFIVGNKMPQPERVIVQTESVPVQIASVASPPPIRVRVTRAFTMPFAVFPPIPQLLPWPVRAPRPRAFEPLLRDAALRAGLPPQVVVAVARVESDLDPHVISHKGAIGLMQVLPATGARFGVKQHELFEPHRNVAAGTAYLRWLFQRYDGDLDLTLAAYNAGEGAVDKYGGIPPYRETQEYVRRVRAELDGLAE